MATMTTRDPLETLRARLKLRRSVSDPVASDTWVITDASGRKRKARIDVGRPQRVPNDKQGDWFCPLFVEGWTPHVIPVMGAGPVDSLMNAITVVRSFLEHIAWLNISPRSKRKRTT
jgi:hypothetical protein